MTRPPSAVYRLLLVYRYNAIPARPPVLFARRFEFISRQVANVIGKRTRRVCSLRVCELSNPCLRDYFFLFRDVPRWLGFIARNYDIK